MAPILTNVTCTENGCSYVFYENGTDYRIDDTDNDGLPNQYYDGPVASCHDFVSDPRIDALYANMLQARAVEAVEIPYRLGRHTLWADLRLSPTAARWYLGQVPALIERIAQLFAIEPPWARSTTIYLLDRRKHPERCSRVSAAGVVEQLGGSAMSGVVHLCFDADEFTALEQSADQRTVYRQELWLHELSHAIRPILHWTIEEGLAEYTAVHAAATAYSKGAVGLVLFAAALDAPTPCADAGILALTEAEVSGLDPTSVCAGADTAPYVRVQPHRDQIYPAYYPTSACGWDWLRFHFGHRAVQHIVQASVVFAAMHAEVAPFPFAETVMTATGMSREMFVDYADRFSIPIDDAAHMIAGTEGARDDWQPSLQQCEL